MYKGTSFCFVNSHLNAHVHNVRRRQADYESICSRLVFFSDEPVDVGMSHYPQVLSSSVEDDEGSEQSKATFELENRVRARNVWIRCANAGCPGKQPDSSVDLVGPPVNVPGPSTDGAVRILDHDVVVWFGDLNYRLELSRDSLYSAIGSESWPLLMKADQLERERHAGRVFQQFDEAPVAFYPTYKFDAGTDSYDSSAKQRLPSYCDRVLWRVNAAGVSVSPKSYNMFMSLRSSDHKPIAALLGIQVPAGTPLATLFH